jgi:hypothetical protein
MTTEAGHDDRTLLDALSPREEDYRAILEDEDEPSPRLPQPRLRIVAQGLIIGHLLQQIADADAAETFEARPGLSRHYFEV